MNELLILPTHVNVFVIAEMKRSENDKFRFTIYVELFLNVLFKTIEAITVILPNIPITIDIILIIKYG
jgi:hypothetical protein